MKNLHARAERDAVLIDAELLERDEAAEQQLVARLERLLREPVRHTRQAEPQRGAQIVGREQRAERRGRNHGHSSGMSSSVTIRSA